MTEFNMAELEKTILYEDAFVLAINKQAGWVVNRAHTYAQPTIQDWMAKRLGLIPQELVQTSSTQEHPYGTPDEIFAERLGVVHRLDKDTSGVLLLAKDATTLYELLRQFKQREVQKTYVALAHGKLLPQEGMIRLPMERSSHDFKKFTVSIDGKMSETHYKVKEFFPGIPSGIAFKKGKSYQGFSLVEIEPKTGRTHQIRVHLSAIKHPIVGDEVYTGRKKYAIDQEWCPRQFLHASKLRFTHPHTKKELTIDAPLTSDLKEVVEKFT